MILRKGDEMVSFLPLSRHSENLLGITKIVRTRSTFLQANTCSGSFILALSLRLGLRGWPREMEIFDQTLDGLAAVSKCC